MLLTEIQRAVLEAASSNLQVYGEGYWIDASKAETKFNFIAALKEETPPIELRAHVEFVLDAIYASALIYGEVYNEEGVEIKPEMELGVEIDLPTDGTKTIDMEKLQQVVAGIIGKEPAIVHNERLAHRPTGECSHQYTIEYYWTIGQDDFLDIEMYKNIFLELEKLLNYLKLQRSER